MSITDTDTPIQPEPIDFSIATPEITNDNIISFSQDGHTLSSVFSFQPGEKSGSGVRVVSNNKVFLSANYDTDQWTESNNSTISTAPMIQY